MLKSKMQGYEHTQYIHTYVQLQLKKWYVCVRTGGERTCGSVMIDSGKPRLRMELTIRSVIDGKKVYNTAEK